MTHSLHSARLRGRGFRAGFTLIELLAVVLIVGILAAVALPQYETAVMKSRFMSFMPTVRAIKDAQESYYMSNGKYAFDISHLDIKIPAGCRIRSTTTNEILCGTDWVLDSINSYPQSLGAMRVVYCPGKNETGTTGCPKNSDMSVVVYYNNYSESQWAGRLRCVGNTEKGKQICKTFSGVFN